MRAVAIVRLARLASLVVLVCACGRGEAEREQAQAGAAAATDAAPDTFDVTEISVDALIAPRYDEPLIAGEKARIGMRIRGGEPPYEGEVTSIRVSGVAGVLPLSGALFPSTYSGPNQTASGDVEMAMQAALDPRAQSGRYRLRAELRDAEGRVATAESEPFAVIGEGAPLADAPGEPPYIEVVDAAGRRRAAFVRGEAVTVRAVVSATSGAAPGEDAERGAPSADTDTAVFTVRDPRGPVVAQIERPVMHGQAALPITVPPLARPGAYPIEVAPNNAAEPGQKAGEKAGASGNKRGERDGPRGGLRGTLRGTLRIGGTPFPPTGKLVLDQLNLYGGRDGRAPRKGILRRGETLHIEARTGGGRAQVVATVRLRTATGALVSKAELARAPIALPAPDSRTFASGTFAVPKDIPPGRYQLHVEVIEGDSIAARYRDVLIL